MIEKTEGIVLRKVLFGDSGIIATVLTPDHGSMAVLAKGARRPKSSFAGLLEPGNVLHLVYYRKQGRSVQTLREASYAEHLFAIRSGLEAMTLVSGAMELVSQVTREGDPAPEIHAAARGFLMWLDGWEKQTRVKEEEGKKHQRTEETGSLLIGFALLQLRIADALGFGVRMSEDFTVPGRVPGTVPGTSRGKGDAKDHDHSPQTFLLQLDLETGSLSEVTGHPRQTPLTPAQSMIVREALVARSSRIFRQPISVNEALDLIHRLDGYLAHHIEGLMPRRSERIFGEIFIGLAH